LATGRTSLLTSVGNQTVSVLNQISDVNPTVGTNIYVGQTVVLTGNGWKGSEAVTVSVTHFNSVALAQPLVVQTTIAQTNGALSASFLVPSFGGTGLMVINVAGETSDSQTKLNRSGATLSWDVQGSNTHPIIHMNPTAGAVGTTVSLTINRSFAGGSLSFGGAEVATVAAGNNATDATVNFTVPESAAGQKTVQ